MDGSGGGGGPDRHRRGRYLQHAETPYQRPDAQGSGRPRPDEAIPAAAPPAGQQPTALQDTKMPLASTWGTWFKTPLKVVATQVQSLGLKLSGSPPETTFRGRSDAGDEVQMDRAAPVRGGNQLPQRGDQADSTKPVILGTSSVRHSAVPAHPYAARPPLKRPRTATAADSQTLEPAPASRLPASSQQQLPTSYTPTLASGGSSASLAQHLHASPRGGSFYGGQNQRHDPNSPAPAAATRPSVLGRPAFGTPPPWLGSQPRALAGRTRFGASDVATSQLPSHQVAAADAAQRSYHRPSQLQVPFHTQPAGTWSGSARAPPSQVPLMPGLNVQPGTSASPAWQPMRSQAALVARAPKRARIDPSAAASAGGTPLLGAGIAGSPAAARAPGTTSRRILHASRPTAGLTAGGRAAAAGPGPAAPLSRLALASGPAADQRPANMTDQAFRIMQALQSSAPEVAGSKSPFTAQPLVPKSTGPHLPPPPSLSRLLQLGPDDAAATPSLTFGLPPPAAMFQQPSEPSQQPEVNTWAETKRQLDYGQPAAAASTEGVNRQPSASPGKQLVPAPGPGPLTPRAPAAPAPVPSMFGSSLFNQPFKAPAAPAQAKPAWPSSGGSVGAPAGEPPFSFTPPEPCGSTLPSPALPRVSSADFTFTPPGQPAPADDAAESVPGRQPASSSPPSHSSPFLTAATSQPLPAAFTFAGQQPGSAKPGLAFSSPAKGPLKFGFGALSAAGASGTPPASAATTASKSPVLGSGFAALPASSASAAPAPAPPPAFSGGLISHATSTPSITAPAASSQAPAAKPLTFADLQAEPGQVPAETSTPAEAITSAPATEDTSQPTASRSHTTSGDEDKDEETAASASTAISDHPSSSGLANGHAELTASQPEATSAPPEAKRKRRADDTDDPGAASHDERPGRQAKGARLQQGSRPFGGTQAGPSSVQRWDSPAFPLLVPTSAPAQADGAPSSSAPGVSNLSLPSTSAAAPAPVDATSQQPAAGQKSAPDSTGLLTFLSSSTAAASVAPPASTGFGALGTGGSAAASAGFAFGGGSKPAADAAPLPAARPAPATEAPASEAGAFVAGAASGSQPFPVPIWPGDQPASGSTPAAVGGNASQSGDAGLAQNPFSISSFGSTSAPAFAGPAPSQKPMIFGSSAPSSTPAFGTSAPSSAPAFGNVAPSSAPAFGLPSSAPAPAAPTAAPFGGFQALTSSADALPPLPQSTFSVGQNSNPTAPAFVFGSRAPQAPAAAAPAADAIASARNAWQQPEPEPPALSAAGSGPEGMQISPTADSTDKPSFFGQNGPSMNGFLQQPAAEPTRQPAIAIAFGGFGSPATSNPFQPAPNGPAFPAPSPGGLFQGAGFGTQQTAAPGSHGALTGTIADGQLSAQQPHNPFGQPADAANMFGAPPGMSLAPATDNAMTLGAAGSEVNRGKGPRRNLKVKRNR